MALCLLGAAHGLRLLLLSERWRIRGRQDARGPGGRAADWVADPARLSGSRASPGC
jgi:hypothetical protein